ncbi:LemA family protein [Aquibium carbonis]|uniref:LemA family protein n=1 Tax=Aquibium carbonis TaxID=2495581 RepID=A0A3R9Y780_9HYPH|nr:LemA family protein [Aquibium carbonis]RST85706.1 LemA family protein [Aquibium carbonis]
MTGLVLILLLVVLLGAYILVHNGLGRAVTQVDQGWAGIEVQLKRRHDLVPGLVTAVKSALRHENAIFDRILDARMEAVKAMAGHDPETMAQAEAALAGSLRGLIAYAEDNPDITATANVATFQKQLEETEDQIAASRRLYNGNVQNLNARIVTFPGNIVAALHRFRQAKPFEMTEAERAVTYERPRIEL